MGKRSYYIDSVLRALDILEFLAEQEGASRVTDIAQEIGCSKNTAFRLLQTLKKRDFVRQADDSSYELTFKLLNLGECVVRRTDLHRVARPYLEELTNEFGETASIAILDGHEIVYLDRVLGNKPYHTSYSVGDRAKAYATSLGKAILAYSSDEIVDSILRAGLKPITEFTITDPDQLLAHLRETAIRGYAIDNQENILGIRCVGAPVFNRKGDVIAAISVSGLVVRLTADHIKTVAKSLLSQTATISSKLGYSKPHEPSLT
jgi:IclR family KDG regulon transcriptional repressor